MEKWKQGLLFRMLVALTWAGVADAQTQIPVGDFETWAQPPFTSYEEPSGGWWTTLNGLTGLGSPETVTKTTDSHSGTYAAKLTTQQWGTLTIPGLLLSGDFDIQNPNFLVQGQPFTEMPTAFRGWYKFSPVAGDSAGIAALLVRWNASSQRRDTIALAVLSVTAAVSNWIPFDLPFVIQQQGVTPDSILVALVSSGDGQNFNGQVGSTLWIDDLELDYATAVAPESVAGPRPLASITEDRLRVQSPVAWLGATLSLTSISGQVLWEGRIGNPDQSWEAHLPGGTYMVRAAHSKLGLHRQLIFTQ